MNLNELKKSSVEELYTKAEALGIAAKPGLGSTELLLAVLRAHSDSGGSVTGSGTLETLPDGFGFLRSSKTDYSPTPQDVYVSPSQIRRFRLSTGDDIVGQVRPPRESERYFALLRIESVNGLSADKATTATQTAPSHATHGTEKLLLINRSAAQRLFDLLCPIAKGNRVLLLAPPRSRSSQLLLELADAAHQTEGIDLLTLLIAQTPEILSEYQDADIGSVVASSFDESSARHTQIAEMVFENARRQADAGKDVLVLVDSFTRLANAASHNAPGAAVNLPAGLSFKGLAHVKRLFAMGRKVAGAGSVTLIAVLRDSGEAADTFIRNELIESANAVFSLSPKAAKQGCALPIDLLHNLSDEERFLSEEQVTSLERLRLRLQTGGIEALQSLQSDVMDTENNLDFLKTIA